MIKNIYPLNTNRVTTAAEKELELEHKFESLKSEGKLQRYLEKKARRKASKDKKKFYMDNKFI
jgi:hypothetical protein